MTWKSKTCPYCGYHYNNLNDYAYHLDSYHPIEEDE